MATKEKMTRAPDGQALRLRPGPVPPQARRGGQVNIEITFSMIIIVMLLLGMIRVFFWVGNDLADRRRAHEATLTGDVPPDLDPAMDRSYKQIRPTFYEGTPMDAITINSEIFGPNRLQR